MKEKKQWEIDYDQRVKAIQNAIREGHEFYCDTYLGKLKVLSIDGSYAHTEGRSWAICNHEIYQWAKEIKISDNHHF
ncbi:MAG: hypothetical protein JRI26_10610 [Deltaproteobacteria bacterium]|nr:hypothetical protein [Deltaproteobacteria bacterium]